MISRVVLSTLLISVMVIRGFSQQAQISLPYTQYTVADGLAQMQVRHIYVDHDGLVWIGTQGGLSVFDGSVIRNISNQGPLAEEYIMSLARGADGLYVSTLNTTYTFDGSKISVVGDGQTLPDANVLFEDAKHAVWFKDKNIIKQIYIYQDATFKSPAEAYPVLSNIKIERAWGDPAWDKCYILDAQNKFYVFNPSSGELLIDSLTFSSSDSLLLSWNFSADKRSIIIQRRGNFGGDPYSVRDLYRLNGDELEHVAARNPENGHLQPLSPNAPRGYVGEINRVSALFVLMDSVYLPDVMPRFSYIRFMVEANHKMYLGTDNGFVVVHADGLENITYPDCDYPWSVVPGDHHDVYLGCYKSGVHQLAADGRVRKHYILPDLAHGGVPGEQILSNYLITTDRICWGSNSGFLSLQRNTTALKHILAHKSIEALAYDPFSKSVLAGSDKIIWYSPDLSEKTDSMDLKDGLLAGGFINDLAILDHQLWVAAPGGIERIHLDNRTTEVYTKTNNNLPCKGGVTLDVDQDGNLWSGGTCGLMVRRNGADMFEQILPDIITQRVNQVALVPGKRLVCASNNNLYLADISRPVPAVLAIYNRKNGLNLNEPSENGNCMTDGRYVWLPSVSGIQRLDLSRVPGELYPAKIMLLKINGRATRFLDNPSDSLFVSGPAALLDLLLVDHSGRAWQFQFQMDDHSFSPWQSSPELLVSGLRHGQNNIMVRASWNTADPSTYTELPFVLHATLPLMARHQTHRALIAIALILIGFVVASVFNARRNAGKAERLKGDLYRNRLKTIQVYLNPHFLFNTLSSIQDRVLHQDAKEGNDMIVRLARVFRKVLDNGKIDESKIPLTRLSEEIALIQDIVYLNNKQLNRPVRFSLSINPGLAETDPHIPPMLIQPFVENAFKHAFSEDDEEKTVSVTIEPDQGDLIISILDNGIGYGASSNSRANSSLGIQLAEERMNILNELNIANSITIKEVQPHGTLVLIKIKQMA